MNKEDPSFVTYNQSPVLTGIFYRVTCLGKQNHQLFLAGLNTGSNLSHLIGGKFSCGEISGESRLPESPLKM